MKKPDWLNVIIILTAGAAIVWMMILIGKSNIGWVIP